MSFINIAICDDDIRFASFLEEKLCGIDETQSLNLNIEVFSDGQEIIQNISEGNRYDIIYLDIEMKYIDGLEAARQIRKFDETALLIYVTNYTSYALRTFEVRPFRFIVKPVSEDLFQKYFWQALGEISKNNFYFYFKYDKASYKILVKNIIYFESVRRIIHIHTVNGTYKFYGKISAVEDFFSSSTALFLRIHQSFLINYVYIQKHAYSVIELTNGSRLNISPDRRKNVTELLCNILGGNEFG